MSTLTLGERLEKDFDCNNRVKDADIYIRMGKIKYQSYALDFLRKIYSILSTQLVLTCVIGALLFYFQEALAPFLSAK